MTPADPHYATVETLIGAAINGVLSLILCLLVFGGSATVPVRGAHSLIADAVPQAFMVTLMSLTVPALLTRACRRRSGLSPAGGWPSGLSRHLFSRALAGAVLKTSIAVMLHAWLLPLGRPLWPFAPVLAAKVLYGAILGACLTCIAVRRELVERP